MSTLISPTVELHESFLAAMAEFTAEGRGSDDDHSSVGGDLRRYQQRWHDPAVFTEYVDELLAAALPLARELGIADVMITCDADTTASERVIRTCGGAPEDRRGAKLRFWIPHETR